MRPHLMIHTQKWSCPQKNFVLTPVERWTPSPNHIRPAHHPAATPPMSDGPTVLPSFHISEGNIQNITTYAFFFFNDRAIILGVSISEFQRLWLEWKWAAVSWPFQLSYYSKSLPWARWASVCRGGSVWASSSVTNISDGPLRPTSLHTCLSSAGDGFESVCPHPEPDDGIRGASPGRPQASERNKPECLGVRLPWRERAPPAHKRGEAFSSLRQWSCLPGEDVPLIIHRGKTDLPTEDDSEYIVRDPRNWGFFSFNLKTF